MTFTKLYRYILIKLRVAISQNKGRNWEDLFVEIPLAAPYPKGWELRIHGFGRRESQLFELYLMETEGDGALGTLSSRLTFSGGHSSLLIALCDLLKEPNCWSDSALEEVWSNFTDVAYDAESECIEEDFLHFNAGTHREEIWHFFDERYSKGVADLFYPGCDETIDAAPELPDGPLFTEEECSFVRKFGAQSEADALIKAMEDFADRPNIPSPVDAFAGLLYQMVHMCKHLMPDSLLWIPTGNKKFLVYTKTEDDNVFTSLCEEQEVINLLGFRDCSRCEYIIYDISNCGYPVKLDEVALAHEPSNHHALVNPVTGETVIEGYSLEH